jgi:hypothetical protein
MALKLKKVDPPLLKLRRIGRDLDFFFICQSRLARHSTLEFRHSAQPYGLGAGVGRGLGVGSHLPTHGVGFAVGVGVAAGVAVDVAVGVAVGVGVAPACAQYLPPVFNRDPNWPSPPQTTISLPLQIAV